jgi:NTE family protein
LPTASHRFRILLCAGLLALAALVVFRLGRVTRPVNPPLLRYRQSDAHQFERLELKRGAHEDLVILAFSGGGTRAAAFAYGALETLRRIDIVQGGRRARMLDEVDLITGVSGGSFTALAYGLYGESLFEQYETRFLRRNVQGMLVRRAMNPLRWPALASSGWGRSEMAADLYDELLFHGATFADVDRLGGPAIAVGATELSTGSRIVFIPQNFDVMCADLGFIRLARAAAASSAVPVVLSPLTIDNYGGRCGYEEPSWLRQFTESTRPPRPAGRLLKRLQELRELDDAKEDRYFHLVDGGVSDNLGLRGVLDYLETFEALRASGQPTPLDHVRRIILFVVNSVSSPSVAWNESENPPRDAEDPREGGGGADQPLRQRVGRAAEGHRRALDSPARDPQEHGVGEGRSGPPALRRERARRRHPRHRRLVPGPHGREGAPRPQRAADLLPSPGRGDRPAARRRGDPHPELPRPQGSPPGGRSGRREPCAADGASVIGFRAVVASIRMRASSRSCGSVSRPPLKRGESPKQVSIRVSIILGLYDPPRTPRTGEYATN